MIPEVGSSEGTNHEQRVQPGGLFLGRRVIVLTKDACHKISFLGHRIFSKMGAMYTTAVSFIRHSFTRSGQPKRDKSKIEADLAKALSPYHMSGNLLEEIDQFGQMANKWDLTWDEEGKHIVKMSEQLQKLCESIVATSIARSFNDKKTRRKLDDQKVDRERAEVLAREIARAYLAGIYRDREKHLRSSIKKVISKQKKMMASAATSLKAAGNTGCLSIVSNQENALNFVESVLLTSIDSQELLMMLQQSIQMGEGFFLLFSMIDNPHLTIDDHLANFSSELLANIDRLQEAACEKEPELSQTLGGIKEKVTYFSQRGKYHVVDALIESALMAIRGQMPEEELRFGQWFFSFHEGWSRLLEAKADQARSDIQNNIRSLDEIYQTLEDAGNRPCARAVQACTTKWEAAIEEGLSPLAVNDHLKTLRLLMGEWGKEPSKPLSDRIGDHAEALEEAYKRLTPLVDKALTDVLQSALQPSKNRDVVGLLKVVVEHYQKVGRPAPIEVQEFLSQEVMPHMEILQLAGSTDEILAQRDKFEAKGEIESSLSAYEDHARDLLKAKEQFKDQPAYSQHIDKLLQAWDKRLSPIKIETNVHRGNAYWKEHKCAERLAAEGQMLEMMRRGKTEPLNVYACEVSEALQEKVSQIVRKLQGYEELFARVRSSLWIWDRSAFDQLADRRPESNPSQFGHWIQKIERALGEDIPSDLVKDIAEAHHLRRVLRSFISA